MAEELYTLEQARKILLGERCARQGHQIATVAGDVTRVHCGRCEQDFRLVPIEEPVEQTRGT